MTLPSSGQLSLGDIANEFGFTDGSSTKLGDYRTTNGQGNFPVSFGALQFNSIDAQSGGSVPTSGQIKFSDFYSTRLQQVVNFYGSGRGGNRLIAKDRYNAGGSNDVNVVGNYRTRPNDTSGTKVHIHVNQTIGSEKSNVQHCALRTGSWSSSTILQVDIGGSGRIRGGGGDGGRGSVNSGGGFAGGAGTSGLGVQYSPTQVNIASGGIISGGFGGGGKKPRFTKAAFKSKASKFGGKLKNFAKANPLATALAVGAVGYYGYQGIKRAIDGPQLDPRKDFTKTGKIQFGTGSTKDDRDNKKVGDPVRFTYGRKETKNRAKPFLTPDTKNADGSTTQGSLSKFKKNIYTVKDSSGKTIDVNKRIQNSAFTKQLRDASTSKKQSAKDFIKKYKKAAEYRGITT